MARPARPTCELKYLNPSIRDPFNDPVQIVSCIARLVALESSRGELRMGRGLEASQRWGGRPPDINRRDEQGKVRCPIEAHNVWNDATVAAA